MIQFIERRPQSKLNYAVAGMYFLSNEVVTMAGTVLVLLNCGIAKP